MNILALDLSYTSTGYSVLNDKLDILTWGKINTTSKDIDSKRINIICEKCKELSEEYSVDVIVVEDQFVSINKNTALKISRLFGAIMYLSQIIEIDLVSILPSKIRSILLNNGSATKEEVAEFVTNFYSNTDFLNGLGFYSDKKNKNKTSDIYDSISIGMAYFEGDNDGEKLKQI